MAIRITDRFVPPREKLREVARLKPPSMELIRYKQKAESDARALMEIFSIGMGKKVLLKGKEDTATAVEKFIKEKGTYLFNRIKEYNSKVKKLAEEKNIEYLVKLTKMLYMYHFVLNMYEKAKNTDEATLYTSVNEALKWNNGFISDEFLDKPHAVIKKKYDDRYPFILAYGNLFDMKEWETAHMGYPEGRGLYKYYEVKIIHFPAEALIVIPDAEERFKDMKEKLLEGTMRYVAEGVAKKEIEAKKERFIWEVKLGVTQYLIDEAAKLRKYGGVRSQVVVEELFMHCVFEDPPNRFAAFYREAYQQLEEECRTLDLDAPINIWSNDETKLLARYAGAVRERIGEMLRKYE